jgi:hypothetical protein
VILEFLAVLVAAVAGGLIGVVVHEISHFVVLRAAGRSVSLSVARSGLVVYPRVGFPRPVGAVPWDIRVAAIAPFVVGLAVGIPALVVAAVVSKVALAAVVGGLVWTAKLSKQDRRLARGQLS